MMFINRMLAGRKKTARVMAILVVVLFVFSGICLASSEGGHGGEPANTGWKATDTYKAMNFTVLVVALFLLLKKPVSSALNDRIDGIRNELQDLEAQKDAAQKKLDEYTQKLTTLEQEATEIIADYKAQGESAKAKILEGAKASAAKIEQQAQRNIENEFAEAKKKLQQDIFEKAIMQAEELVKTKITPDDQNKLVDEYLEKVVAQ